MPAVVNHPGVYIEEVPSPVRTIVGVGTSITAFVGRAARGPLDTAVPIRSFDDFASTFGGLWADGTMGYAVRQYFDNGGADAIIVRVANDATPAGVVLPGETGDLTLEAADPGLWGCQLTASIDVQPGDAPRFDLTVVDANPGGITEVFRDLSAAAGDARHIATVLDDQSTLVRVQGAAPTGAPAMTAVPMAFDGGSDGARIGDSQITGSATAPKTGIHALDAVDRIALLCIPPYHYDQTLPSPDPDVGTLAAAAAYCVTRCAVLIVDPPIGWNDAKAPLTQGMPTGFDALLDAAISANAALYFPRLVTPDSQRDDALVAFAPCGAVAGVIARTDATRGVWKAPAGIHAGLLGVTDLSVQLNDADDALLNAAGIDCLRNLAGVGPVVWGTRTMSGANRNADQWKYLPVRRLALHIGESLRSGLQWAVFEPNDDALWSKLRLDVASFMATLFHESAFQGATQSDAFFVLCDGTTTTQDDVDRGIVVILVGFAPLKPAEFVIVRIEQMAGWTQQG